MASARRVEFERAEFERLAIPHTRSLLRVARRMAAEPAYAEDLVQETLLLAWRSFHQLRPDSNPRAWLFRILFNVFNGQGRKLRTMPERRPLTASVLSMPPRFDDAAELRQALDSLEAGHRTVLLLGVVEGFSCREMAEILSIPIGTVMSRLSRARQAMRLKLAVFECAGKEI